jgi:hypothetical protein
MTNWDVTVVSAPGDNTYPFLGLKPVKTTPFRELMVAYRYPAKV